jgi:hypothetical protein
VNPPTRQAVVAMVFALLAVMADPVAGAWLMPERPTAQDVHGNPSQLTSFELTRLRVVLAEAVRQRARLGEPSSSWAAETVAEHGQALRRHVEVTCEELARLIYDAAEEERLAGVGLLERLGGPAAIPALVTATGEPGLLGRLAWEQLMRTRGRELIPTLSSIVFEHPDPLTRLQALETLLVRTHFGAILRKLRHLAVEEGDSEVGRFARGVLAACRRPTQSSLPA